MAGRKEKKGTFPSEQLIPGARFTHAALPGLEVHGWTCSPAGFPSEWEKKIPLSLEQI